MTPTAAPTSPSVKTAAVQGAKGTAANDALHLLTGQEGGQAFGQPFEQLLQQQLGPAPLPANLVSLLASQHAGDATNVTVPVPAHLPPDDADPAERNGNVMAAAMLAMLGQSQNAAIKTDATGGDAAKGDAAQGLNLTALKSHLTANAMTDGAPAQASATNVIIDAASMLAGSKQGDEHAGRKSDGASLSADLLAAPLMSPGTHATHAPQAPNLQMDAPVGSPAFAEELSQHVAWLGGHDVKEARIRLRPEELGQLDVKVSVAEHGKVDVSFTAQHPQAVLAVQQTLGQLDLMLAGHGLSLGQAQVGQQSASGNGGGQGQGGKGDERFAGEADAVDAPVVTKAVGLLDTFA
ncbi:MULTISPECIES: flagellar hook-length control protein FliK [Dyella]|uniref:Flagellar hook-length control protein FliK n=2 Tax=Dyella TaxID=231454 RepID=A0A4R0YJX7_9GAMM|nr:MULTISPECIES: flagellar hook-length control protein FliK [Dyella]TBR37202.1 flagellar hook-length control protein FliK [Dyella terrae]TCI07708.1 flagellar hook-length control protein FliK [Dyella soli]